MKAVLFELDGTPTDPRVDECDLLAHLFPGHGPAPTEAAMVGDRGVDSIAPSPAPVAPSSKLLAYRTR